MKFDRFPRAAVAAVLLIGLLAGVAGARKPKTVTNCGAILFSAAGESGYRQAFSATQVVDLEIHLLVPATPAQSELPASFSGDHTASLRVLTPRGHLYQELLIPFTVDPIPSGKERRLAGFPHPVKVQKATRTRLGGRQYYRITLALPVAGTPIISSGIYGDWSVEAFLDDRRVGCIKAASFTMTP